MYVYPIEEIRSGNEYFDVRVKFSVYDSTNSIPVTLTKIMTVQTGTKFYNSYCGSKVIDTSCSVSFKIDENVHISIKDKKEKDSGVFIVNGCIWWIADTRHNPDDNNHPPKMLRE